MIPAGFEPATVRLEGECSIQLSYETKHNYLILSKKLILVNFFVNIGVIFINRPYKLLSEFYSDEADETLDDTSLPSVCKTVSVALPETVVVTVGCMASGE